MQKRVKICSKLNTHSERLLVDGSLVRQITTMKPDISNEGNEAVLRMLLAPTSSEVGPPS